MTMTRHHGGECGKGPYHSPPCDPPDSSVDVPDEMAEREKDDHDSKFLRTLGACCDGLDGLHHEDCPNDR